MQVDHNKVVTFHYTVKTPDGETIDTTDNGEPLSYLHGHRQIIDGLEEALVGKTAGEKIDVEVGSDKGYGPRDPKLDLFIPLTSFPEEAREQLQMGMMFQAAHPEDPEQDIAFTVLGVEEEKVMVTGNHPLAGQDLCFSVEIQEVREATEDELTHGHAHGAEGHDHD